MICCTGYFICWEIAYAISLQRVAKPPLLFTGKSPAIFYKILIFGKYFIIERYDFY